MNTPDHPAMLQIAPSGRPLADPQIIAAPLRHLVQLVQAAYKDYTNLTVLADSLLADTSLVSVALLVAPDRATPDDIGRALRSVLSWAAGKLAPSAARLPAGERSRHPAATFSDPSWWKYNIIHHYYLFPDLSQTRDGPRKVAEFVQHKLEIPSRMKFAWLRRQALTDIARLLLFHIICRRADAEITDHAVRECVQPLHKHTGMMELSAIAANYLEPFPLSLLVNVAQDEGWSDAQKIINRMVEEKLLIWVDDNIMSLFPAVQRYFLQHQTDWSKRARNERIARWYESKEQYVIASRHLIRAGQHQQAAELLLTRLDDRQLFNSAVTGSVYSELSPQEVKPATWSGILRYIMFAERSQITAADPALAVQASIERSQDPDIQGKALISMSMKLARTDIAGAIALLDACLQLPIRDPIIFTDALRLKTGNLINLRRVDEAAACVQRMKEPPCLDDLCTQATILELSAVISFLQHGDAQAAINTLSQAADMLHTLGLHLRRAVVLHYLIDFSVRVGNLELAQHWAEESMAIARRSNDGEFLIQALCRSARIARKQGNAVRCYALYKEALDTGFWQLDRITRSQIFTEYVEVCAELNLENELDTLISCSYILAKLAGVERQISRSMELLRSRPQLSWLQAIGDRSSALFEVLLFALTDKHITVQRLCERLNLPLRQVQQALTELTANGVLSRQGSRRGTRYVLEHIPQLSPLLSQPMSSIPAGEVAEQRAMELLTNNKQISTGIMTAHCDISRASAQRMLSRWHAAGFVEKIGNGAATRYRLTDGRSAEEMGFGITESAVRR